MVWTLTDAQSVAVVFDNNPRTVLQTQTRQVKSALQLDDPPISVDIGIQAFTLKLEAVFATSSKVDSIEEMAKKHVKQPVVLSSAGIFNGTYFMKGYECKEYGGYKTRWDVSFELWKKSA